MPKERKSSKKEQPAIREKLSTKDYEKALYGLHVELVKPQLWIMQTGGGLLVFEGRDGAGKGGMVEAIAERVSPRIFRVVALPARAMAKRVGYTSTLSRAIVVRLAK